MAVPDGGHFGDVCLGDFVDRDIVISNRGPCPLEINGLTSSAAEFDPPDVTFFPIVVAAGSSIALPIRFRPSGFGPASATISISSNDPGGRRQLRVSGNTNAPRLAVSISDDGDFGHVCVDDFRDEPLTLSNSGQCPLTIESVTSSDAQFLVPKIDALPVVIAPGAATDIQVRFQPSSFGPKSATITITSDDPLGPTTIGVSGTAPSGKLVITGSGHFGPVDFGRRAERTITLHNTGECDLHVTNVGFLADPWKPGCRDCDRCNCDCGCGNHSAGKEPERLAEQAPPPDELAGASVHPCCGPFKIVSNPFPATVHPGSSLPVLIRFTATCSGPKCCELVIETDDPSAPSSIVYVTGSLHRTLRSALKCWAADELQELLRAGKPPC